MSIKRALLALVAGVIVCLGLVAAPAAMAAEYPPGGGESESSDPADVGGVKVSDPAGAGLARTGSDFVGMGAAAVALIGVGAGLVVVVRRRREPGTAA